MSFNLMDLTLLILIPTTVVRAIVLLATYRRFVKIFEGNSNFRTARRLIKELELPGLDNFIRQEIIFGVIPYLSLVALISINDLRDFVIGDSGLFVTIIAVIGLIFWVLVDIGKSILIYRKLGKLASDTSKIKQISGSAIEGLRFIVHRKGVIKRTLVKYTISATKKSLEKQNKAKKSWWKKASIRGLAAVENITTFPEKVTQKLADWMKEDLDERLASRFEKYSSRSKINITGNFLWSLFPCLLFTILYIPSL